MTTIPTYYLTISYLSYYGLYKYLVLQMKCEDPCLCLHSVNAEYVQASLSRGPTSVSKAAFLKRKG